MNVVMSKDGTETARQELPASRRRASRQGMPIYVESVAFSPDGAHIVSGSSDNTVRIWDATTGAEATKMERHSDSVQSVAFSPDGAHVVSGSANNTVQIWQI